MQGTEKPLYEGIFNRKQGETGRRPSLNAVHIKMRNNNLV
jgi:hypothetical protein